jgi:hypothetical protein
MDRRTIAKWSARLPLIPIEKWGEKRAIKMADFEKILEKCLGGWGILFGMSDVTRILSEMEAGEERAAEELLPLVYEELRKLAAAKLAQEQPGQTLQATALVHEAYLRLIGECKEPRTKEPKGDRGRETGNRVEQSRAFFWGGGGGDAADFGGASPTQAEPKTWR